MATPRGMMEDLNDDAYVEQLVGGVRAQVLALKRAQDGGGRRAAAD